MSETRLERFNREAPMDLVFPGTQSAITNSNFESGQGDTSNKLDWAWTLGQTDGSLTVTEGIYTGYWGLSYNTVSFNEPGIYSIYANVVLGPSVANLVYASGFLAVYGGGDQDMPSREFYISSFYGSNLVFGSYRSFIINGITPRVEAGDEIILAGNWDVNGGTVTSNAKISAIKLA